MADIFNIDWVKKQLAALLSDVRRRDQAIAPPPGSITQFAGLSTKIPESWILCDGRELSKATYPALWAMLDNGSGVGLWDTCAKQETAWGNWASPAAGNFRVPDLRNQFLRGVGTNQATVATALAGYLADTTAKNGLGISGTLGVTGNANIGHTHASSGAHSHTTYFSQYSPTVAAGGTALNLIDNGAANTYSKSAGAAASTDSNHSHTYPSTNVSITSGATGNLNGATWAGDLETRPDCVGIHYIIKV